MTVDHMESARFAVSPQVLHEAIEGEVIIIDLTTGSYYSLRGSAAEVWQLLCRTPGVTSAELVDALVPHYEASDGDIGAAVSRFIGQLCEESLARAVEASDEPGTVLPIPERNGVPPRRFEPPVLEKYTDMQDLVLLDPVHEVDEMGWPQRPDVVGGTRAT